VKPLSLQIAAALVILTVGIPLSLFPLKWARAIKWTIPDDVKLARYFGRCLGVVVTVLAILAAYASTQPPLVQPLLAATAATMILVAIVHVVGWLEKAQPFFETVEIAIYSAGGAYFAWLALA
jgi:hypothetical protein